MLLYTQGSTTVQFGYDNANRRTSLTLPNGVVVTYGYDNGSQLTALTYKKGTTTLGNLTYGYDLNGRRTSVGGSYARTGLPNAVSTTVYNANNQLTTWGATHPAYDPNGNMTSDGTHSYTWDARNHLKQIDAGATGSFVYDPFGRRSNKTISGTATSFLYDGANAVQEVIGANTANSLMGGVDEVFQRTDTSGARSFLTDALGSTVALTDSAGTVQTSYTVDPFGNTTTSGAANSNTFAYTGRELDAANLNLYFYRARYYNPQLQRFISEDPIGFRGGINLYSYAANNPVSFRDPSGLNPSSGRSGFGTTHQCGDYVCNAQGRHLYTHAIGLQSDPIFDAVLTMGLGAGIGGILDAVADSAAGASLSGAEPVGSALKDDAFHRGATFVRDEAAQNGRVFPITGADGNPATLTQLPGGMNGITGRFEYIVNQAGELVHQMFVPGGGINGIPIKP